MRKTKDPCPECSMYRARCLCAEIPKLVLKTKLSLLIHYRELRKPTNSGTLAVKAMLGSRQITRGRLGGETNLSRLLLPDYENVLFFPAEDALELTPGLFDKPVHLIVPDGNWRQAAKVNTRHPEFKNLPRVKISAVNVGEHHLRRESTPHGMSTLEAIAKAIAILEGEAAARPLLELYQLKLSRTLAGRGLFLNHPNSEYRTPSSGE